MTIPAIVFLVTTTLFIFFLGVAHFEQKKQKRLFARSLRNLTDRLVVTFGQRIHAIWQRFTRYGVKLGWYYSVHSLLRTMLRMLVSLYTRIEHIFETNRMKVKKLRRERKQTKDTHLTVLTQHQERTALTAEEKVSLRAHHLENDH
jgi:hypothetical protein